MQTFHKWFVARATGRDEYNIYSVRYEFSDDKTTRSFNFTNGEWVEFPEGGLLSPAFTVPGQYARMLTHPEREDQIPEQLTALVQQLIEDGSVVDA